MTTQKNSGFRKIILSCAIVVIGVLMVFHQSLFSLFTKAELEAKIEPNSIIMPAAYKVYGNETALDGKYGLFKMLLTNNGKTAARNVNVTFEIPGYIEETNLKKVPLILPGQSILVNCFPKFKEDIVEKRTASREVVNININGLNIKEQTESFPIEIKGRNEYVYTQIPVDEILSPAELIDNADLLGCFVTPEDPIIKYFTQQIQEKILKGESASVMNSEQEAVRFLGGIYDATYLSHMVYSGTSGVPTEIGDATTVVQSIRLPREVVTGKTGLCIELSVLYASVLMNAGLDPIIYLIPGHAYPGFRMNGKFYAIEATGIGGEGMKGGRSSAAQAFEVGMKQLQEFMQYAQMGDERYQIIDIRETVKNGVSAMELKDDTFLRGKVDEIARSFESGGMAYSQPQSGFAEMGTNTGAGNTTGNQQNNRGNSPSTPSGYKNYKGKVSFSYPSSWASNPTQMPEMVGYFSNANYDTYAEVYEFRNTSSPQQALGMIRQYMNQLGGDMQFSLAGQTNGFQVFNGQSYFSGNSLQWVAAFKPVSAGVAGVIVGKTVGYGNPSQTVIENILNSIH